MGQRELAERGEDPQRLSPAAAIRAFQSTLREYRLRPETAEENLWSKLRVAIRDDYERTSSKMSRNYPRKKQRERMTAPKITRATKQQINTAKELKEQRLPA